ncbi:MAG: NAD-glutamate dehydrogenase [Maricaulaceae bacterium]|nr:NAD-glutamate dehydrogenase [Maricaulaceae bacterium]
MTAGAGVVYAFKRAAFDKAAAATWKQAFSAPPDAAAKSLLAQIYDDALAEDLEGVSADALARLAAGFWGWSAGRKPGQIIVRVFKAGGGLRRDILEIAGPDRPFLVDSVMGEIGAQGLDVLAMFHPIITVKRPGEARARDESLIQVHVEPLDSSARERLETGVRDTLNDVAQATQDWADMRKAMDDSIARLEGAETRGDAEEKTEALAFLRWLRDDHFAFLGSRIYDFGIGEDGAVEARQPRVRKGSGLGILRDSSRHVLRKGSEPAMLTPAIEAFLNEPSPIIVAKANIKSRVHRRVYMDYIGVKQYREDGAVCGEARFVGLFTAEAYDRMARDVPLLRRKVRRVLERAGKTPGTHNEKKLRNIVENYPRDELFQANEDELLEISLGVLHLFDRPRTKMFIRRDRFDRFISVLLFVPRDRYSSKVREQAGELIREAYNGRMSAYYPQFGDGPLARVHFIIGLEPYNHPEPDLYELERRVAHLARTWDDDFVSLARDRFDEPLRARLPAWRDAFTAGYRERYGAEEAVADMARIEALAGENTLDARLRRDPEDSGDRLRLKIYQSGAPVTLSAVLPVLENMGLTVLAEAGYPVRRKALNGADPPLVWAHDFEMRFAGLGERPVEEIAPAFEAALLAVFDGRAEDDGFNRLILQLGVGWRDAAFLRACARYRQQSGMDPSQAIQEEALAANPKIVAGLLELAKVKFDPSLDLDMAARKQKADEIDDSLRAALDAVASLDHDRVLRRLLRLVEATLRTNFHQAGPDGAPLDHICLKIASRDLEDLPLPKPYREIFVCSPQVEGVHLRFGPVARGGLRWSDRRDDFRTEVLGLVKAQQVKNAVIVPVGSKGGFYPKQLPRGGSREEVQAEGVSAYKAFIRGLLDVTDNIGPDGAVVPPDGVVRWDADDPYLVVAADKGTATFSDIANGVAVDEYDFWLGDAFASGGSAGYDHKGMGITARGAWESVKRHFREMGKDIQSEPFTVIGVGDMSGDVFGNGMLLSKQIRLVAAFDHRDIFIDPDPADPGASWAERKRLFDLPRSSWQDYDARLISKGGGVFPRSAKTIPLSAQMRSLTGIAADKAAPSEVINALLRAEVELLWFGGIGTYVKASGEQHFQVGDRANDALRADAADIRAAVVGEGANLGFTQAARIEYARKGGRINADFVDNSAGVDTSDHEVNIKILLNPLVRGGAMSRKQRDVLLEKMTGDVAAHVLQHNYDQTLSLSLDETDAPKDIDAHERFMARLEAAGRLDRKVEGLPDTEAMRTLKTQGLGLTRPELAILTSYAKITLFDTLVASDVPDDAHFRAMLRGYFPKALHKYEAEMQQHRLKREIIATVLANQMVNLGGPTFVHRAIESTGADTAAIARAFEAGRCIFGFDALTARINALDNKAPAQVQAELHDEIVRLLRRQTYWLARRGRGSETAAPVPVDETIAAYKPGVDALKALVSDLVEDFELERIETRAQAFIAGGAPKALAYDVARLRPLTSSSDVVDLAAETGCPLESAARVYHAAGSRFEFNRLRSIGNEVSSDLHWDRLAVRRLIEDLYASQYAVAASALRLARKAGGALVRGLEAPDSDWAIAAIEAWSTASAEEAGRADAAMRELDASGAWTLSKLAIASTQLREMAQIAAA